SASKPRKVSEISPFTFATALSTPRPPYQLVSPSRSSCASAAPVDAPEGTLARPNAPPSSHASTSTVGRPRESRIWRARSFLIDVFMAEGFHFIPPLCFRGAPLWIAGQARNDTQLSGAPAWLPSPCGPTHGRAWPPG